MGTCLFTRLVLSAMWPHLVAAMLENPGLSDGLDVQVVITKVCSPFSFSFVFTAFRWRWCHAFIVVIIDGRQSDCDWEKCA